MNVFWVGALGGGSVLTLAGALSWLLRTWIKERLKNAVSHEYQKKLETFKGEVETRLVGIRHERQLEQLRTSLFFDHQRQAFSTILSSISKLLEQWFPPAPGDMMGPPPRQYLEKLTDAYFAHQLFLDNPALAAIELVREACMRAQPMTDEDGNRVSDGDGDMAYAVIQYVHPRLGRIFRAYIEGTRDVRAEKDIALLGGMQLINNIHFTDIDIPPKGALKLSRLDVPAEIVKKGAEHLEELKALLEKMLQYISDNGSFFHDISISATRYLEVLSD